MPAFGIKKKEKQKGAQGAKKEKKVNFVNGADFFFKKGTKYITQKLK